MLLRELLFADDCTLIAHTKDKLQSILNDFARAASRYGLTISSYFDGYFFVHLHWFVEMKRSLMPSDNVKKKMLNQKAFC